MDKLHYSLLLEILSRLDDSADVARCRVASKAFNAVFPGLRSINLNICCPNIEADSFKKIFLSLIFKLETVESVSIKRISYKYDDFYLSDVGFLKEWLSRVSRSLKSLSMSFLRVSHSGLKSNVNLPLISAYCDNLLHLNLAYGYLYLRYLNPMPMLTSLTLTSMDLYDQHLNMWNKCFPNLQVLNLVNVRGLNYPLSLILITPNLITLKIDSTMPIAIHVEAPMLSRFHLILDDYKHMSTFNFKKCENLKTLSLESPCIISLLSKFPITQTVETLTLYSQPKAPEDARDSKLSLAKVFMVFPNVSSLCINSTAWSEIEAWLNTKDRVILGQRKRLKTICAYLRLFDPTSTLSSVGCVLDHCVGLSEVYLLIHADVVDTVSESFMSKCMARWPGLKWRWGIWNEHREYDIFN